MDKRTHISRVMHAAGEKAQYNNEVKQIFRDKTILAWVLKYTTKEFRELSIDTIRKCIEGEPEIAKVPVYPGHTPEAITGSDTSDNVIGEGTITYDVRFYVITPDEKHIKPQNIYGNFKGKARYDLLSVVNVCLGDKVQENKLVGMLSALLSMKLRPEEKEAILQEYGIETTKQLEEGMASMCNLADLIEEKGIEKGIKQGMEQGIEIGSKKVQAVR